MRHHAFAISLVVAVQVLSALSGHAAKGGAPVQSLYEHRTGKVVRQDFDLSCGAAALATVLRYQHGEDVSEKDVALGLIASVPSLSG
jgi:predicted double-glycine peptidase